MENYNGMSLLTSLCKISTCLALLTKKSKVLCALTMFLKVLIKLENNKEKKLKKELLRKEKALHPKILWKNNQYLKNLLRTKQ